MNNQISNSNQLSISEILFIRACKKATGELSLRFIEKVYLRFYILDRAEPIHLCNIMLRIIEKTDKPIQISRFVDELSPSEYWKHPEVDEEDETRKYWYRVLNILVNHIRYMTSDEMKNAGFKSGVKWRRMRDHSTD